MKIALLTHKLRPPLVGGVDVYTDRLGRALLRQGHSVVYLAFDSSGKGTGIRSKLEAHEGTPLWRITFDFDALPKETFDSVYNPEMGRVACEIFAEEKPDLIVVLNFYMITLAPVEAAHELGIPVAHVATDFVPVCRRGTFMRWDNSTCRVGESIQTCSTCFVSHRALGRLASRVLERLPEETVVDWARQKESLRLPDPRFDLVFAPTQFTYDTFVANGFDEDQVLFLPFGVDEDNPLATMPTELADHVRFMFLGRLQPYKGGHLVVEAFNRLANPQSATLTIYGAPDGHDDYFARLRQMMDANPDIHFAGLIPPTELASAFARADIFLLPSTWHENSPLILLDALQSKTPVIASDIGGVRGIVEHERNGLLFPMGDVETLQAQMQRVIDQPALRSRLQAGGQLQSIDAYARTMIEQMQAKRPSLLEAV